MDEVHTIPPESIQGQFPGLLECYTVLNLHFTLWDQPTGRGNMSECNYFQIYIWDNSSTTGGSCEGLAPTSEETKLKPKSL